MDNKIKEISICVLGDISPGRGFFEQFKTGRAENVFHDIVPVLQKSDLVIANLEGPATDKTKTIKKTSINFKANPQDVALLKEAGVDGLSLANNHILDFGIDGLKDTMKLIKQNEMFNYGVSNYKNEVAPYFCTIGGKKIGILSFAEREFNCAVDYGMGATLWDDLECPKHISKAKEKCDFLIVQYHGGIEHYIYPSPYLQKKCRCMADAGADFVTCQHSHCIGTHERWNQSEILYGQGNTLFGHRKNEKWNTGLIVVLNLEGDKFDVVYRPIIAKEDGEYLLPPTETESLLSKFENESSKLCDVCFIKEQWREFCRKRSYEYLPLQFARGSIINKLNKITKGKLIRLLTKKADRGSAMNLIRCDAHREVVRTILEEDFYKN